MNTFTMTEEELAHIRAMQKATKALRARTGNDNLTVQVCCGYYELLDIDMKLKGKARMRMLLTGIRPADLVSVLNGYGVE